MSKRTRTSTSTNHVMAFAQSVALPVDTPVVRMRDQYTATDTATAQPFLRPVLPWATPIPAASAGSRGLPPDTSLVVVTGDPLCSLIYEDKNSALTGTTYRWMWGRAAGANTPSFAVQPGATFEPDLMGAFNIAGQAFHSANLWSRRFKGKNWVWVDGPNTPNAANIIQIVTGTTAIAATDLIAVTIFRLNEGDEIRVSTLVLPATPPNTQAASLQIPARDYYRVEVMDAIQSTTASIDLIIQHANACAMFVHRALPDIDDHSDEVTRIHMLGSAVQLMNTANEEFRGGSWVADQVEPSTVWTAYARPTLSDGFSVISGQRGQKIRQLATGGYGFLKPVEEDDFNYVDPFRFDVNGDVCHRGNFDSDERPFIIFMLKAGGTTDATDPSRSIQLFFNYNVEYETKDSWTAVAPASVSTAEASKAIAIIATMEQFYENPIHWDRILSTIGKVARLAAPLLALIPHPYAKAAAAGASAVGAVLPE